MRIVARSPKYEALPTILSRRYSKSFLAGKISRLTAVLLLFKILGWSQSMRLASMIGSKCTAVSKYASRTPGPDERRPTRSGSPNQSEAEMRVHRILPCVASTVMSAFIIHGDHTATEGPVFSCTLFPFTADTGRAHARSEGVSCHAGQRPDCQ